MILFKRLWAKVIENSSLLTASFLRSFTSLVAKHLLDHFLSLLTAHLLLALILHYYSSLTLHLTLFLSCATHTLPWVFSNLLQTTFHFFSLTGYYLGSLILPTPWNTGLLHTTAKLSSFQIAFYLVCLFPFAELPVTSLPINYLQTSMFLHRAPEWLDYEGHLLPECDSTRPHGGTCRTCRKSWPQD